MLKIKFNINKFTIIFFWEDWKENNCWKIICSALSVQLQRRTFLYSNSLFLSASTPLSSAFLFWSTPLSSAFSLLVSASFFSCSLHPAPPTPFLLFVFLFFLPFFSAFSHYVLPFFSPSVQLKTFFSCFMSLYLNKSSFSSYLK